MALTHQRHHQEGGGQGTTADGLEYTVGIGVACGCEMVLEAIVMTSVSCVRWDLSPKSSDAGTLNEVDTLRLGSLVESTDWKDVLRDSTC